MLRFACLEEDGRMGWMDGRGGRLMASSALTNQTRVGCATVTLSKIRRGKDLSLTHGINCITHTHTHTHTHSLRTQDSHSLTHAHAQQPSRPPCTTFDTRPSSSSPLSVTHFVSLSHTGSALTPSHRPTFPGHPSSQARLLPVKRPPVDGAERSDVSVHGALLM